MRRRCQVLERQPGCQWGADGGSAAPSGSISSFVQGAGGEERDAGYYRELRQYTSALEQYIQQNSGTVEIGEFEVIEPQAEAGAATPEADEGDSAQPR
jgi:hypothetical protein